MVYYDSQGREIEDLEAENMFRNRLAQEDFNAPLVWVLPLLCPHCLWKQPIEHNLLSVVPGSDDTDEINYHASVNMLCTTCGYKFHAEIELSEES